MTDAIRDVIEALRRAETEKQAELRLIQKSLAEYAGINAVIPGDSTPESREYEDLGPIEAIRRYMTEVGEPQTTRQLADALLSRGLRTKSRNFVASIHATLKNAPRDFRRNERGQWELVVERLERQPSRIGANKVHA